MFEEKINTCWSKIGTMSRNNGQLVDLSKIERRTFLKYLGGSGAGIAGLNKAVSKAVGEKPEGKPLVWTRDAFGNPEVVRYIPEERHRRLMVYKNMDIQSLLENHPSISYISMSTQTDNNLPELELYVNGRMDSDSLPDSIQNVPTVEKEANEVKYEPDGCRDGDEYSRLKSNIEISIEKDSSSHYTGTIGLIGYNNDPNDTYKCIVTAYHVVEERINNKMYHPAFGEIAGYQRKDDPDMDTTKYEARVPADVGATAESGQPEITGTWDFAGLTDATDGTGGVNSTFAGKETCSESAECIGTTRDDIVDYQANYQEEIGVGGDSGGPYVDSGGKLVSLHYGDKTVNTPEGNKTYSIGPVGTETLERLNVTLTDPGNIS